MSSTFRPLRAAAYIIPVVVSLAILGTLIYLSLAPKLWRHASIERNQDASPRSSVTRRRLGAAEGDYDPGSATAALRLDAHLRAERIERHCRAIKLDILRPASMKKRWGAHFGLWWQDYFEPSWACPLEERIQLRNPLSNKDREESHGDGGKWVCDAGMLGKTRPCLVYSFGSNGDYSFELGLGKRTDGKCEVHVFDPFNTEPISATRRELNSTKEKLAGENIHVHNFGIASHDYTTPPLTKWKGLTAEFKSLQSIASSLNHAGRTIDVLKIDIDGGEYGLLDNSTFWDTLDQSGIKIGQLLLEVHFNAISPVTFRFRDELNNWVRARTGEEVDGVLRSLLSRGFAIFHKEVNLIGRPPNDACEFSLIRLNVQCGGGA